MQNITVLNHPLVHHKMTMLRNKNTPSVLFRQVLHEITPLLAYESTRHLLTEDIFVHTPICGTVGKKIKGKKVAVISILRAGNGLLDGFLNIIPNARVGFVGMERDETTAQAHSYYCKLPKCMEQRHVIVIDPMLATGGSAIATIAKIKKYKPLSVTFAALISVPEGVQALQSAHSDVHIVVATMDEKLNAQKYIVPGLGDAGDRIFGTVEK